MFVDVEETLGRELYEVADSLQIPPMPQLQGPARVKRNWQPMLVAAAVVLIIAGAVAVVATSRGDQKLEPAPPPPSPSPSRTEPTTRLSDVRPALPFVLDQRLYVDGEQVPGTWWSVRSGANGWLALRTDNTWWWGRGAEPNEIAGAHDVPPVISPNGEYIAEVRTENGEGVLTGFDTTAGGGPLGSVPIDLGDRQDGSAVSIRAVTNDGKVIAQGTNTSLLWLPLAGDVTVDLSETAPGQQILGSAADGLVVTDGAGGVIDGAGGEPYLAEISEAGELTPISAIPAHDDVLVSPGAEWLVWTEPGTMGGEVTSVSMLEVQTVDGTQRATLSAPDGWGFRVRSWMWEGEDHVVSPVVRDGEGGERMARCSVQPARCVLIRTD
jgi:hypothetical protein